MKLKDIKNHIESQVPPELAIEGDFIGFMDYYDLDKDIKNIKIYMDLFPENDKYYENTLILTHHKPLFKPKTPTYVLHSNWDIIEGGANDALAKDIGLEVIDVFDKKLGIGRICKNKNDCYQHLLERYPYARIVSNNLKFERIAVISGFGLKNPDYIKLAKEKNVDTIISGDLTHETAVLAMNNNITLIDLGHHMSEVPGLNSLTDIFKNIKVDVELEGNSPVKEILKREL